MSDETSELQILHARWQAAREVTKVLHESWAGLLQSQRLFLQSASLAGIKSTESNKHYKLLVAASQKEYAEAFKQMCMLADEYMALKLSTHEPHTKGK